MAKLYLLNQLSNPKIQRLLNPHYTTRVSLGAAAKLEEQPVGLLHFYSYDSFKMVTRAFSYRIEGNDAYAIVEEDSSLTGLQNRITLCGGINGDQQIEVVNIEDSSIHTFLPFDVANAMKKAEEETGETCASINPFLAHAFLSSFQQASSQMFANFMNSKNVVELGSGWGGLSFILSQFLPNDCQIVGYENMSQLVSGADIIKSELQDERGYNFPNISFQLKDVTTLCAGELSEIDAVVSYIPTSLYREVSYNLFALRPGAIFVALGITRSEAKYLKRVGFERMYNWECWGHNFSVYMKR